jgi:hypothetical protein
MCWSEYEYNIIAEAGAEQRRQLGNMVGTVGTATSPFKECSPTGDHDP